MANQGNRDREGNLGKSNPDTENPTGTTGRQQGNTGTQSEDSERNRQEGGDRNRRQSPDEGDESLGTRNTNR